MSDSILDRFTDAQNRPDDFWHRRPLTASPVEDAEPDDLGTFGWLRGVKERALMLELQRSDGNILAIGYSWLERAEFNPSSGITLHAAGRQVHLRGRNLNAEVRPAVRLFQGLVSHRVPWIRELRRADEFSKLEHIAVVECIEW